MEKDSSKLLRKAARIIAKQEGEINFPELSFTDETAWKIFNAARDIAKNGDLAASHKIKCEDLAALISYIADML